MSLLFMGLVVAGAFGAGMAWAQARQRALPPAGPAPVPVPLPAPFDPPRTQEQLDELWQLKPGDVLVRDGQDHAVANVVRATGGGHHVAYVTFADDPATVLLCADIPTAAAWWCNRLVKHGVPDAPSDTVVHRGIRHRRVRRAEVRSVDAPEAGRVVLQWFEGPDGAGLWLWQGADGTDVLEARLMRSGATMVLPR